MDDKPSGQIIELAINEIEDFPNHPFAIRMDDQMIQLVDSISRNGVLSPAIVRPLENGQFQMISGHRRKEASKLQGLERLPCLILNLSDEEATILMVDSNLQREEILPSEKAKAYKMRLNAMNKQGMRSDLLTDETSSPMGMKLDILLSNRKNKRLKIFSIKEIFILEKKNDYVSER